MYAMERRARLVFAAIFAVCAGLLAFGYYLQYGRGLEPCPMCIFQRLCFFAVMAVAAVAALHAPGTAGTRIYAGLVFLASAIGAGIAGRQTWLQHLPADRVPECGPGLDFMLEMYPLWDVISKALKGTGECADKAWVFLGLSIAEWSLLWFLLIALTALWVLIKAPRLHGRAASGYA